MSERRDERREDYSNNERKRIEMSLYTLLSIDLKAYSGGVKVFCPLALNILDFKAILVHF